MAKNKKGAKGAKHKADVDGTGTAHGSARDETATRSIGREDYEAQLHVLQVELVKLQRHFIRCQDRILVVLEGRDAAGKDGSIKRMVEYLSPRARRVSWRWANPPIANAAGWYFQRYVPHLPVAEELVLFNRSWYNRAGRGARHGLLHQGAARRVHATRCRSSRRCWSARASSC
jgi:polyphosphate kinase 2 (PPK2 family)